MLQLEEEKKRLKEESRVLPSTMQKQLPTPSSTTSTLTVPAQSIQSTQSTQPSNVRDALKRAQALLQRSKERRMNLKK